MTYVKPQNNRGIAPWRHSRDQRMDEDRKPGGSYERSGPLPVRASSEDDGDTQGLTDHTQQRLGIHLRAMYDSLVQQPVPDRFRDLIARLEAADRT